METIDDLFDAIMDANNVKEVTFNPKTQSWHIKYKNGLPEDVVQTSELIEFLRNA